MVPIFFKISYQISSFSCCHCRILIPKLFGICMQKFGFLLIKFFFQILQQCVNTLYQVFSSFLDCFAFKPYAQGIFLFVEEPSLSSSSCAFRRQVKLGLRSRECSRHRCEMPGSLICFWQRCLKAQGLNFDNDISCYWRFGFT